MFYLCGGPDWLLIVCVNCCRRLWVVGVSAWHNDDVVCV